jgi:uncharacterized membrane protein
MGKANLSRAILGGLLAGVVFMVAEFVVEGLADLLFKFNESRAVIETFNLSVGGARFHIVNLGHLFVLCILIIWVYTALRPRFGPGPKTALITSAIFLSTYVLLMVNLVNLGIFPAKIGLASVLFNFVELPIAVFAGASIYKEG